MKTSAPPASSRKTWNSEPDRESTRFHVWLHREKYLDLAKLGPLLLGDLCIPKVDEGQAYRLSALGAFPKCSHDGDRKESS